MNANEYLAEFARIKTKITNNHDFQQWRAAILIESQQSGAWREK